MDLIFEKFGDLQKFRFGGSKSEFWGSGRDFPKFLVFDRVLEKSEISRCGGPIQNRTFVDFLGDHRVFGEISPKNRQKIGSYAKISRIWGFLLIFRDRARKFAGVRSGNEKIENFQSWKSYPKSDF